MDSVAAERSRPEAAIDAHVHQCMSMRAPSFSRHFSSLGNSQVSRLGSPSSQKVDKYILVVEWRTLKARALGCGSLLRVTEKRLACRLTERLELDLVTGSASGPA